MKRVGRYRYIDEEGAFICRFVGMHVLCKPNQFKRCSTCDEPYD
jgi:hypothetical protein